ncbi:unnamed protein product, partial [Timema podura]|nr:unnamed protein product [Timema podura]
MTPCADLNFVLHSVSLSTKFIVECSSGGRLGRRDNNNIGRWGMSCFSLLVCFRRSGLSSAYSVSSLASRCSFVSEARNAIFFRTLGVDRPIACPLGGIIYLTAKVMLCGDYYKFTCDLIALGNGTASRDVEKYISDLITSGWFSPLNVQYTIISEEGSSVYSCSPLAKKEFPSLDPKLISAVSLARRVQDPLSEYIKVDPKHLGVGMYQHDLKEKHLNEKLQTTQKVSPTSALVCRCVYACNSFQTAW